MQLQVPNGAQLLIGLVTACESFEAKGGTRYRCKVLGGGDTVEVVSRQEVEVGSYVALSGYAGLNFRKDRAEWVSREVLGERETQALFRLLNPEQKAAAANG